MGERDREKEKRQGGENRGKETERVRGREERSYKGELKGEEKTSLTLAVCTRLDAIISTFMQMKQLALNTVLAGFHVHVLRGEKKSFSFYQEEKNAFAQNNAFLE